MIEVGDGSFRGGEQEIGAAELIEFVAQIIEEKTGQFLGLIPCAQTAVGGLARFIGSDGGAARFHQGGLLELSLLEITNRQQGR